jgi:hypothetical protein
MAVYARRMVHFVDGLIAGDEPNVPPAAQPEAKAA